MEDWKSELEKTLGSKGYKNASAKISAWKKKLATADRAAALRIRDEKGAFFARMLKSDPRLYSVFSGDDKALGQMLSRKLTGHDAIIDC
ncbi:MAG: hypothetical protein U0R44_00540 [Candidatus Micrarchaeia archaeon]